jgi:uncharacterized protein YndB with AHSA1/START domain
MPSTALAVTIARPVAEVFAVLTDPETTSRWSSATIEEHWTTPPPLRIGSRRHATTRMGILRAHNETEIVELEPNRHWKMTSVSGPRFSQEATFTEVPGATRVDWVLTVDLGRVGNVLLAPASLWMVGRQLAEDLARLKALMEAGTL